ncbi:MAG: ribonuclease P protein component [Flavobacterium sp.]|nr:MAG: ribonuclease P protein component [Flavobacterium sp.]
MNQTYPTSEKLKSRKTIDLLFSEGKSIARFPLRLVYVEVPTLEVPLKMGVSASKKHFKKAVDRNYVKRILREAYRVNKQLLSGLESKYAVMLLYQSKELPDFHQVNANAAKLFLKFAETAKSGNEQ